MADQYDFYRKEIAAALAMTPRFVPTRDAPRIDMQHELDRNIEFSGYWRLMNAKTKTDWPIAIFIRDDGTRIWQWGKGERKPFPPERYDDFRSWTFPHLAAILKSEFTVAGETGVWPDGRRALPAPGVDEEFDLGTPPPPTGDEAPEGTNLAGDEARDAYAADIRAKIEPLEAEAQKLFPLNTKEKCERAAKIREDIRKLGSVGETQRKAEKRPLDEQVAKVQGRWAFLKPADEIALDILTGIDGYQRTEQRRLQKEADDKAAAERKRIADETAARLREEQEAARREAVKNSEPEPEVLSEEAIKEAADAAAIEQMAATPAAPVKKPEIQATPNSRATSKAKVAKGRITDIRALCEHFIHSEDADFLAYCQKRVDGAARVKINLPGMERDDG